MTGYRFWTPLMLATVLAFGACAPSMPNYPVPERTVWLEQGWTAGDQTWYHHADQGTLTFGVPYEWFVALEQPALAMDGAPLLSDKSYLNRFGFIPGDSALPVGFARGTEYRDSSKSVVSIPATNQKYTGIGLTCAACHTGRMTYNGTEMLIDGSGALTDVVSLNKAFVFSILYTRFVPFRFERFATRVLGQGANAQDKEELHKQFETISKQIGRAVDLERATSEHSPTEGFGRLDAINRIGNRVFGLDMQIDSNYEARPAPVHYPHIWNAPWFTWVQYNGSIMQPMVRNAGEALGVGAAVNLSGNDSSLFESTVHVGNLHRVEQSLAGKPPFPVKAFSGLQSPTWPSAFPPIVRPLADKGAGLYKELCQGCHLPPPGTAEFWRGKWWTQIDGKGQRYLALYQIPVSEIGTDAEQARGMANRTVTLPDSFNALPEDMKFKSTKFGLALGQLVENVTSHWYQSQIPPVPPEKRAELNGDRPNRLQVPLEYKARPLNGIWASPPYLHNGSVPNLYALLSPVSDRPSTVYLGNREFDPRDVGYKNEAIPGSFALNTNIPGNRNTGHEFRDGPKGGGVIGRALSPDERRALIEYLKTM